MADMADTGRGAEWDGREKNGDNRKGQLTKIFLFAASLAACMVDKAQMSESVAVVVLATHGDAQGT